MSLPRGIPPASFWLIRRSAHCVRNPGGSIVASLRCRSRCSFRSLPPLRFIRHWRRSASEPVSPASSASLHPAQPALRLRSLQKPFFEPPSWHSSSLLRRQPPQEGAISVPPAGGGRRFCMYLKKGAVISILLLPRKAWSCIARQHVFIIRGSTFLFRELQPFPFPYLAFFLAE